MKNKCIVFDVDGTLFDTKNGIISALNEILEVFGGKKIENDEEKYIGPPIKESLMIYQGLDEQNAVEATELYRSVYVEKYIEKSSLYDGMRSVLDSFINQNNSMFIATMKTQFQIEKLLEVSLCKKYFKGVEFAREDGSLSKKDMLLSIKNRSDEYKYYYMVGDTLGDYKAAIDAGYVFIAADYGYGDIGYLDCIHISSPTEIVGIVNGKEGKGSRNERIWTKYGF